MQILDLLWTSRIIERENPLLHSKERTKAIEKVERGEEALKAALTPEQAALLDKFLSNYEMLGEIYERDNFVSGFRLGAMVMLDVFGKGPAEEA